MLSQSAVDEPYGICCRSRRYSMERSPATVDPGVTVPRLVEPIVAGGWPDPVGAEIGDARQWLRDYLRNLVEVDVQNLGARRDPRNVRKLLTALGRTVGTDTLMG